MSAVAVPAPRARGGFARAVASIAMWLGIGLAGPLVVLVAVPPLFGFHNVTILSGSMTPTLRVGDVIVERKVVATDIKIGDVITFPAPKAHGKTYTHRVVSIKRRSDEKLAFVTQGDANPTSESWAVAADGTLGLAQFRIGKLGYITNRAGSKYGRLLLLVIPVILLGIYEFRRIWAEPSEDA